MNKIIRADLISQNLAKQRDSHPANQRDEQREKHTVCQLSCQSDA